MHLRGKEHRTTWKAFWNQAEASDYFKAVYDETSERMDWSLSERQLFTQSNGRTLLGQDTMGRLHFLCTPHDRIYAVPSGGSDAGGQFKGHIGQYYQNDTALLLGKMRYDLEMDNGRYLAAANTESVTEYRDYFLPTTTTTYKEMQIRVFSFAPVMEKESVPLSAIHPLPGPAAAFFCMEVTNTAGCTLKGKVRLSFDQKFVNQFEHYGRRFEDYTQNPYRSEWDQKLLILWHPESCAAIQLQGAVTEGEAENPRIFVPFTLKAGESRVFTTMIAVTPKREEIYRNLGIMYQHTPLEWANVTAEFWKERLGHLTSEIREEEKLGEKYSDMHIRFILDNFNCLSFNEQGRLLTNWQGAPSHSLSRLWGIDIEPDVVSVMYAVPEVGPRAIEYLLERNQPRFSLYSDHSMFFYISPLLIAGKYLELTGDTAYFLQNPRVCEGLERVYQGMLAHKHGQKALFSSHYASDLIVFKKYDYGANVQCYYALKSYCRICEILGTPDQTAQELLKQMPVDLASCMEEEGPFGRQIIGGNNLGEDTERFYIPDEHFYYGGEDTATVLAPLYGLYEPDYEPYVNLHRFAQSMFITNYDPEFRTLRELHFGMNPSATGCTLRLGGSHTRREMLESLRMLYERLDETGSLFWWPRGVNRKRCLTRCSQGQGAWVQQSVEQWYGLRMDGVSRTLQIRPQGLLSSYQLDKIRTGAFCFSVKYEECESQTRFSVTNHNDESVSIEFFVRPFGAAAENSLKKERILLEAGETVNRAYRTEKWEGAEAEIVQTECRALAGEGCLFAPYGIVMPKLSMGESSIFLLRFVIAHTEEQSWKDVRVDLSVPKGWRAAEKQCYVWEDQPVFSDTEKAECAAGELHPDTHGVAGFYISMPDRLSGGEKSVMLSGHPFPQEKGSPLKEICLYAEGEENEEAGMITAVLYADGMERSRYVLPVRVLDRKTYAEQFERMYHGSI